MPGEEAAYLSVMPTLMGVSPLATPPACFGLLEEPTLYVVPPLDTWFRQQPEPAPRPRLGPVQYAVGTLEPTLILTPGMDTWFMQISQPAVSRQSAVDSQQHTVRPVPDHEAIIPGLDRWSPVCGPPPVRPPQPQSGWWAGVLERTLFETPGVDSWFCQPPDPIRPSARTRIDPVEPPEWRPLAIGSQLLSWYAQGPDPLRRQWHPGEVTYSQPPAITPADAVLTYGETATFKKYTDSDDIFLRT